MAGTRDTNGWTGGYWSLIRAALGILIGVWGLSAMPLSESDAPATWMLLAMYAVLVIVSSHYLAFGVDREGSVIVLVLATLAYAWRVYFPAHLYGRHEWKGPDEFAPHPLVLVAVLVVLLHLTLHRPDPFGSLAASGRPDPGGGWSLRNGWHRFSSLLFLAYATSTAALFATHLTDPDFGSEWTFLARPPYALLLLVLVPTWWYAVRARLYVWLMALGFVVAPAILAGWTSLLPVGLLLSALAFDPGWIRAVRAGTTDLLFYDGGCGFCHAGVRFALAEDRSGSAFTFAPIGGAAWAETFPASQAAPVQTVVVRTADGRTLDRSTAALHVALRLGGVWRVLGTLGLLLPRPLRDLAYRGVARIRHLLFRAPTAACPRLTPALLTHFDLRPSAPPP